MKVLFFFLPMLVLPTSCNSTAKIQVGNIQIQTPNRIGGKEYLSVKSGGAEVVYANNNENSFQAGASVAKIGLGAWAASDIFRTGAAAYSSVKNASTAAGVSRVGAQEATKQAGIKSAAEIEKMKLAAEVVQ